MEIPNIKAIKAAILFLEAVGLNVTYQGSRVPFSRLDKILALDAEPGAADGAEFAPEFLESRKGKRWIYQAESLAAAELNTCWIKRRRCGVCKSLIVPWKSSGAITKDGMLLCGMWQATDNSGNNMHPCYLKSVANNERYKAAISKAAKHQYFGLKAMNILTQLEEIANDIISK